jgi:hypothetical protein
MVRLGVVQRAIDRMECGSIVADSVVPADDGHSQSLAARVESTRRRKNYTVTPTRSGFNIGAGLETANKMKLILNRIEIGRLIEVLWQWHCLA